MERELLDPVIMKEFRLLISKMIQIEMKKLDFNKTVQGVIVEEPTDSVRACSVVLNHNMSTLPDNPLVVENVPIRNGLNVQLGDEVLLNKINNSGSYYVDYNKYTSAINLITTKRTVVSNTTINIHDNIIYISASSDITLTLPISNKCVDKVYIFVRLDTNMSTVTVQGQAGETINGAESITIGNFNSTSSRRWIHSTGSAFFIINSN